MCAAPPNPILLALSTASIGVRSCLLLGKRQDLSRPDVVFPLRSWRKHALQSLQRRGQRGRTQGAQSLDLAKFFDTVNHDVLMGLLGRTIRDKRLLGLIGRYLRAGVLVGEHIQASEVGTPQGGPLSPLHRVRELTGAVGA